MAEIRVPRWVISQMCMPSGVRTSKKPVLVVPALSILPHCGFARGLREFEYTPQEFHGVFEGMEYRFWCMSSYLGGSIVAECRACGNIRGKDANARRMHAAMGKCYKKLTAAYKLLLKDSCCVICDAKTNKTKWGIPICGATCMEAWCEQETTPPALQSALALIGDVD